MVKIIHKSNEFGKKVFFVFNVMQEILVKKRLVQKQLGVRS